MDNLQTVKDIKNNIIDVLESYNLINDVNEFEFEQIYISVLNDKSIPERWLIDIKTFCFNKFPDIHEKYEILASEIDNDTLSFEESDLDEFLSEEVDYRNEKELIEEANKSYIDKQSKNYVEKQKEFKQKVVDAFKEDLNNEEKRKKIEESYRIKIENARKSIEQMEKDLESISSGNVPSFIDDLTKESD